MVSPSTSGSGSTPGLVLFGAVGTSGEVSVTGDAVNVASRIEHAAPHGSVLISHDTYRHVRGVFDVRPLEPLAVKGKSSLLADLRRRAREAAGVPPRDARGRGHRDPDDRPGARARRCCRRRSSSRCGRAQARLVTVIGDAGAGKSRLLDEFTAWMDLRPEAVHYLKGRSVPERQDVPRGLLRELFAFRFQIFDDDAEAGRRRQAAVRVHDRLTDREADVVGSLARLRPLAQRRRRRPDRQHGVRHGGDRPPAPPPRTPSRSRRPVVMLLEDVHWADDESLDAVVHLVGQLAAAPLLVVCLARPDVRGAPPGLDGRVRDRPTLIELTRSDTRRRRPPRPRHPAASGSRARRTRRADRRAGRWQPLLHRRAREDAPRRRHHRRRADTGTVAGRARAPGAPHRPDRRSPACCRPGWMGWATTSGSRCSMPRSSGGSSGTTPSRPS